MVRQSLDGDGWTVRAVGGPVPAHVAGREIAARVPGCVHVDLIRAGLIADPALGMNELECQWVGECDWAYRRDFEVDSRVLEQDARELVFKGLDTVAEFGVNGVMVPAASMFCPHALDVYAALRPGRNTVEVVFRSPLAHIREEEARLGARPINGDWAPYVFARKAACNFGWDWGPKVATCGIWQTCGIEAWTGARVDGVRTTVGPLDPPDRALAGRGAAAWIVEANISLRWDDYFECRSPDRAVVRATVRGHGVEVSDTVAAFPTDGVPEASADISLRVDSPRLWWPRGQGEQALYDLIVELDAVEVWRGRIGFREARLLTGDDPAGGSRFALEVNGREIFCKGANWIPEGLWPSEVPDATLRRRVEQAAAANMNMLRVWGGGSYERDAFYDACDELGILVWQDFMFACAMYPEEPPYPDLIEREARHQVRRLSGRPCVVLWCGGNECVWAHDAWGVAEGRAWKERLQGRTWGAMYYYGLLGMIVDQEAPGTAYWANSPWPGRGGVPINSAAHGDRHTWDARGAKYRTLVPRFCSEFGHQSPASVETLRRALGEAGLVRGSAVLEHRQRGTGGTAAHIDAALEEIYGPRVREAGFEEWHRLAQEAQARSLRIGIEWLRVNRPRCMGALVWQLNDAWAGMSWSLIDSGGVEKPAYRAVAEAFRPRIVTVQPWRGEAWLWAVNDEREAWETRVDVRRASGDGRTVAEARGVAVRCGGDGAAPVVGLAALVGGLGEGERYVVAWEGGEAVWEKGVDG